MSVITMTNSSNFWGRKDNEQW